MGALLRITEHGPMTDHEPPVPAVVADQLHSAAIHLLRRLRLEDAASGLTAPRLSALSVVVFGGPLALGALAAAEQVRPPTMTRIVAGLERAGLVERSPHPTDGRQVLITATQDGRRLLDEGRSRRTASLAPRLAALSPDDVGTLSRAAALIEQLAKTEASARGTESDESRSKPATPGLPLSRLRGRESGGGG